MQLDESEIRIDAERAALELRSKESRVELAASQRQFTLDARAERDGSRDFHATLARARLRPNLHGSPMTGELELCAHWHRERPCRNRRAHGIGSERGRTHVERELVPQRAKAAFSGNVPTLPSSVASIDPGTRICPCSRA